MSERTIYNSTSLWTIIILRGSKESHSTEHARGSKATNAIFLGRTKIQQFFIQFSSLNIFSWRILIVFAFYTISVEFYKSLAAGDTKHERKISLQVVPKKYFPFVNEKMLSADPVFDSILIFRSNIVSLSLIAFNFNSA